MTHTRIKALLLISCCLLAASSGYSQLGELQSVQQSRFYGQKYLKEENYDSAYLAMSEFIDHSKLINPFDYLNYALCTYKRKDTVSFLKYLNKAIDGGVDSVYFSGYLKKLTPDDKTYFSNYIDSNYERLRKSGWAKYDTALINEVNSILRLDQYMRDEFARIMQGGGKSDSNFSYLAFLGRQTDSINYIRITRLSETGRFPGYHNCGAFTSVVMILIHVAGYDEEQWEYIFSRLKAEALTGNISPDEVANIADNHYQSAFGKLCSYYGHWAGRTKGLCDCKNVDRYRAEIGLETLKDENELWKETLPDCYEADAEHKTIISPVK